MHGSSDDRMDEAAFDRLEDQVDSFAAGDAAAASADDAGRDRSAPFDPAHNEQDFEQLVSQALDELPDAFQRAMENVAVVVSDKGAQEHAYGQYVGWKLGGARHAGRPDEILIFRDTLVRDFGNDPDKLRAQVTRTVRHEVAHYLGYDEPGVRGLGL
jgi:predicted Zn-dependent protease with MMP-like domain